MKIFRPSTNRSFSPKKFLHNLENSFEYVKEDEKHIDKSCFEIFDEIYDFNRTQLSSQIQKFSDQLFSKESSRQHNRPKRSRRVPKLTLNKIMRMNNIEPSDLS